MFHCTVAEIERRLSASEMDEWDAYFRIKAEETEETEPAPG